MKILHVVPTYLPAQRYGGPIVAVHGLCKALAARGHEVSVFTTNVDGDGELDVPTGISVPMDGVHVHYFPSTFRRIYRSPAMRRALATAAAKADLVHSHAVFLWPGVAAARAARKHERPFIVSPRGMLVPELIRGKSRLAKTLWLRLVERRALERASAIHYTSQLEADDARRTGLPLAPPFVVPNGIDPVDRPSVPRDENTLLFLGRINWKKGLDRAIKVLPPNARLIIAGNDEENLTPRLVELAEQTGVADRVTFAGPVYGEAKWELLARATLVVLLSQSENFGNVVLEALSMETPVVLSAGVGLAHDVVRANAGVVGAEAIAALLGDAARRAEMGRNGRALVESRFTWPRVAAEMEKEYQRCISTTSRR